MHQCGKLMKPSCTIVHKIACKLPGGFHTYILMFNKLILLFTWEKWEGIDENLLSVQQKRITKISNCVDFGECRKSLIFQSDSDFPCKTMYCVLSGHIF
jgi:hypothetical protein